MKAGRRATKAPRAIGVQKVGHAVIAAGLIPADSTWAAAEGVVVSAPAWVDAIGTAKCGREIWIVVEPHAGEGSTGRAAGEPGETPAGQLVLDVAPGRYLIDAYDLATGSVFSRESGQAAPLVIGLPRHATTMALRVRRI